jgi:hypothetical protein
MVRLQMQTATERLLPCAACEVMEAQCCACREHGQDPDKETYPDPDKDDPSGPEED